MNRSLFVMFFMYFFVVQSAIFGVVWWEPKFYIIGIINFVFIVLMALFYKNFDVSSSTTPKKVISEDIKSEHVVHKYHSSLHASRRQEWNSLGYLFILSIVLLFLIVVDKAFLNILPLSIRWFAGFYFVMLFLSAKKLLDQKIILWDTVFLPKDFLFWTSLIVVIGVYGTLVLEVLAFKLLFSLCIWFIFFFIGASIVREAWSLSIFKLFFTRFYLLLIAIFVFILWALNFSSYYQSKLAIDVNTIQSLFADGISFTHVDEVGDVFTWADLLSNGSWQVISLSLSSSWVDSLSGENISDLVTGDLSTDVLPYDMSVSSDTWVIQEVEQVQEVVDERLQIALFPTLMDTLIYLMNHYNVELSTQTNMTFDYVTPKNPFYPQFKTAYEMKLIGNTANPSKRVLCQTYMVMKWLIEEWTVVNATDIKLAYWNEAANKWALNWCKWDFYVKNINL